MGGGAAASSNEHSSGKIYPTSGSSPSKPSYTEQNYNKPTTPIPKPEPVNAPKNYYDEPSTSECKQKDIKI